MKLKLKLKTLGLASILTVLAAAPVFADGGSGHRAFKYGSYSSKRNVDCEYTSSSTGDSGYGPAHTVSLIVTHNTSADQTYALAACGCHGRYVQARAELDGHMTNPVIKKNYAQTLSISRPSQLTGYEMHRVEAN